MKILLSSYNAASTSRISINFYGFNNLKSHTRDHAKDPFSLNSLTASEKELLKQKIKESQEIDLWRSNYGVIKKQEGHPLAYTNIVSISKQTGTITDTNGIFVLNNLSLNNTIKITNIAFQPILIPVKDLLKTGIIFLKEKMLSLEY